MAIEYRGSDLVNTININACRIGWHLSGALLNVLAEACELKATADLQPVLRELAARRKLAIVADAVWQPLRPERHSCSFAADRLSAVCFELAQLRKS